MHRLGEAFDRICSKAVEVDGILFAWVGLVDHDHGLVLPVAKAGHERGYLNEIVIDLQSPAYSRGPTGRAAKRKRSATVCDMTRDADYVPWRTEALSRGYRSGVCLPVPVDTLEFTLGVYSSVTGFFDAVNVRRFERLVGTLRTHSNWDHE